MIVNNEIKKAPLVVELLTIIKISLFSLQEVILHRNNHGVLTTATTTNYMITYQVHVMDNNG